MRAATSLNIRCTTGEHMRVPLLISMLWLSCAAIAAPSEIRIALNSDIKTTEPGGQARDVNTDSVLSHVAESLVAYRGDFTVAPMLAESYDVSKDGRTYTFKLRKGLRFHNGAPVTAADVKWSWERLLKPETRWSCRNLFTGVAVAGVDVLSVEARDPQTVVFNLDRASPLFLEGMASPQCLPAVLHRDSVAADGSWKTPIGTGPFQLTEWKKGQWIVLSRFADYAPATQPASGMAGRKAALVDQLRWLVIPEHAAQKAAMLAGQIDVMIDVDSTDLPFPAGRFNTQVKPGLDWDAMLLQTEDPLLRDVRIRKAIAAAIDAPALAMAVSDGKSAANPSPISVASRWHSTVLNQRIPYDLKTAKRLLAEAGYRGQRLKLQTNKRYRTMHDNAVIIQAMLAKAGMNVELEVIDWAAQLANYREGRFQMMSFGYSGKIDPSLDLAPLIGRKAKSAFYQWDDRQVDDLVLRISLETERPARQALLEDLHRRMIEQVPILPLFNPDAIEVTGRGVSGYETWPVKMPRLWNVKIAR
jgi:peptide/nickel transport system substrate-binding protein